MDKRFIAFIAIIILASFAVTLILIVPKGEMYSVSPDGIISYANRPQIQYTQDILSDTDNDTIYRVSFGSRDATIYGLLSIPKNINEKMPAFFVLPAASIDKQTEQNHLSKDLNTLGYVTLSLDQRGIGETGGVVNSLQQDLNIFASNQEPMQHEMVYDALRAFDLLNTRPEVDRSRIYAAGESMGGRFAIIAAAIEPRIRGLMGISTSGFGSYSSSDPMQAQFMKSIDPDTYIGNISPRPVLFIHSQNDTIIPVEMAKATFEKAGQPKEFFTALKPGHSYEAFGDIEILRPMLNWLNSQ